MKSVPFRSLAILSGVCLFSLIASLLIGIGAEETSQQEPAISANYVPGGGAGGADVVSGSAPPNMELAVYLNGRLLDVTQAEADGQYALSLPVLPPRYNELIALPTDLDPSILALLYDPDGFDRLNVPPAELFLEAPFVAAVTRQPGGLQIYGSAIPATQLDIFAEKCESANANVTVSPYQKQNRIDGEGSFVALLPFKEDAPLPAQYCIRIAPADDLSAAEEFTVAAPAQSPAGGEGLWNRSIEMQFTQTSVRLVFAVEMPDRYLVFQNLASGGMSELQFIEYVFGEISLNAFLDPRALSWRQEKETDSGRVRILVESQPLEYLIPEDTATTFQLDTQPVRDTSAPFYVSGDSVTIRLNGVRVIETKPTATSGDASTQTWRGVLSETSQFKLKVSRMALPLADPIGRRNLLNTLAEKITNLRIKPSEFLSETLEGQIVDVLPVRAPADMKAQVYDYFSAIYRDDPFTNEAESQQTFQLLLQALPGRTPGWLSSLLFGCIWLIPSALTFWALRADQAGAELTRADLTRLASGALTLTILGLDWFEGLSKLASWWNTTIGGGNAFLKIDFRWDTYLDWQAAGGLLFLLLFLPIPRWSRWIFERPIRLWLTGLAAVLPAAYAARYLLSALPDGWASALLTSLPLLGFACLLWLALNVGNEKRKFPSVSLTILALAIIFGLSLPVQSLPLATQLIGALGVSAEGAALARPLLSLTILVGVGVALRGELNETLGTRLRPLARGLGRVLLAGFAVGLTPAWGFLPLSVIGGLILFEWILPRRPVIAPAVSEKFVKASHRKGIEDILKLNRQMRLWRATESSAQKLARENKLNEDEHQLKRERHDEEKRKLEQPDYLTSDKYTLRDLAFNFGAGKKHWDNLQNSLAWGLILAAPLVILQGWPLVSEAIGKAGAFPFLGTGVRLITLTAQYLAAAAFLGYFFPHLRGRNGLEKGGWLSATMILSLIPYHLIYANSLTEWMVIAIWAGSMLAYNMLISLLAFDMRTLLHFKFGLTRLPDLYDFGELAAYLTGSGAPLVTTIITAITSNVDDWVPALLKVVFPSFTLADPQFQLLQILIDIANRVAASL